MIKNWRLRQRVTQTLPTFRRHFYSDQYYTPVNLSDCILLCSLEELEILPADILTVLCKILESHLIFCVLYRKWELGPTIY